MEVESKTTEEDSCECFNCNKWFLYEETVIKDGRRFCFECVRLNNLKKKLRWVEQLNKNLEHINILLEDIKATSPFDPLLPQKLRQVQDLIQALANIL